MNLDDPDSTTEAHERRIVRCSAHECRARIIFLNTGGGTVMPVEADTVEPGDTTFDSRRHESHFAHCTAAGRFRQPR
jgi:hypothetical protein